ncbi:Putative zinc-finger [Desulfonispora thiosulfatigenes DSM 11270]|uniref:Anti-sigma-W factor RsiW n=1 Tax=Desulfonispora thiosulfatigenes DSM 11270 TaxID=656914 RepID=A0A1W1VI58_DESTI|nr:DUF4349 domain-containing protein [Desulfonispora thiosulfatigenes]SMB92910.1 Putative zinc-finger [Desulfonispora thiosulfatigenes DSM 11270]
MKKCSEFQENLSLYLDNYLSDEERYELEEHLENCPECRKELTELQETLHLLKNLKDENIILPADMKKEIRKKLEADTPKNKLLKNITQIPWKILMPLTSAALIMLVIFLGTSIGPDFSKQVKQQASEEYRISDNSSINNGEQVNQNFTERALADNSDNPKEKISKAQSIKEKIKSIQDNFTKQIAFTEKEKPANEVKKSEISKPEKQEENKDKKPTTEPSETNQTIAMQPSIFAQNLDTIPITRNNETKASKNGNMQLEISEKDNFTKRIVSLVNELDGEIIKHSNYIYDQNNNLEASKITLTIAEDNFEEVFSRLKKLGYVKTSSKIIENKQEESKKIKTKIEELRVLENILTKAQEKEESQVSTNYNEKELSKVKDEIKNLENNLDDLNNSISTVTVDLEVKEKN